MTFPAQTNMESSTVRGKGKKKKSPAVATIALKKLLSTELHIYSLVLFIEV